MKIQCLKCKKCGDIIYSRARYDFHYCTCQSCFVDGGMDYFRFGGDLENLETFEMELDVEQKDLYNDYNLGIDNYGIIKGK